MISKVIPKRFRGGEDVDTEHDTDGSHELTDYEQEVINEREHDVATLQHAHSEAQQTLDRVLQTFPDLAGKAIQIIQLNGIVLTIIVAVSTQTAPARYSITLLTGSLLVLGMGLFLISTLAALAAYWSHSVGAGYETSSTAIDHKLNEVEYLLWVLPKYHALINDAKTKANRKDNLIRFSIIAFSGGLILFLTGVLLSVG